jgi:hypothetical protein
MNPESFGLILLEQVLQAVWLPGSFEGFFPMWSVQPVVQWAAFYLS